MIISVTEHEVKQEYAISFLTGLALASSQSVLEPADLVSAGHEGNFWQLLTEATRVASCYQNLALQTQYTAVMEGEIKRVAECPKLIADCLC